MNRPLYIIFALTVIVASLYASLRPSYDLDLLMNLSAQFAILRSVLAAVLVLYVTVDTARVRPLQGLLIIAGLVLLLTGIVSIITPTGLGHFSHYTRIGDMFMAIEGGVVYLLSGLQLDVHRLEFHLPVFISYYQLKQAAGIRTRSLVPKRKAVAM